MIRRIQVIDWLSRKRAWPHYRLYTQTQWFPATEIERFQVAKLRELLEHCEQHVPFYRDVIHGAGIDVQRIHSLTVLEQFPVIDKALVKVNPAAFTSKSMRGLRPLRTAHTGGTTGAPLSFYKDARLRSSSHAAMYRFHEWMGVAPGDPKILVWGAPIVKPGLRATLRAVGLRVVTNTRLINPFTINRNAKGELLRLFAAHRPMLVHGYCQAIYELARWLEEWGQRVPLKAVSTTVEPLFPEYRETFRRVFGCETFDQYGCGEVEMAAGECAAHQGLHLFSERAIIEVDGEGRGILTDLDNRASPFIRYRNGDVVELADQPCPCGRAGQLLKRVLGRTGDVVTGANGNRVHPEFFTHLINELGISYRASLRKYQVVQSRPNHLLWKLAAAALPPADERLLVQRLREYLGDIAVDLEYVDDIPPARSGKFQYVVSRV